MTTSVTREDAPVAARAKYPCTRGHDRLQGLANDLLLVFAWLQLFPHPSPPMVNSADYGALYASQKITPRQLAASAAGAQDQAMTRN